MNPKTDLLKQRPGRKPSGRVTHTVTLRLEESIHRRLKYAVSPAVTQTALVETALDKTLPEIPEVIRFQPYNALRAQT